MAIRAIFRRGLVNQNQLALHFARRHVALLAGHIGVAARQRKLCALVVIKCGGRPALVHMAIHALGDSILGCKLAGVRIRVAGLAFFRRSLELNVVRAGRRFVALIAGNRAMRPDQLKFRFRMVEAFNVHPGVGAVAGFAAHRLAVGSLGRHAVLEFTLVRIGVTGRAGAVLEVER